MRIRKALATLPLAAPLLLAACNRAPQARAPDPIPPRPVAQVITPSGCVPDAAQKAFEVTALKSQLMVAALSCRQDSQYNGFIERNRRHLVTHDQALMAWFRRTYGGQGVRRFDDFITSLANAQSQEGIRQGTSFCGNMAPFFAEVSTVSTPEATIALASTKQFGAPTAANCATPTTTAAHSTRATAPARNTHTRRASR